MSCPQIWKTEKEKVGRQASEAQREKELERSERDRKNKGIPANSHALGVSLTPAG